MDEKRALHARLVRQSHEASESCWAKKLMMLRGWVVRFVESAFVRLKKFVLVDSMLACSRP